ncbi:hypothetical protein EYZ11_011042 [Aspergillus tanneri]|uniref:Uncharacterized protein n=1 Tax=Aspergillus tanneri TaxID=1220188 RepID=A0A4S3J5Z2_9EURO|nr:hypothetical protein EYZ11_011042 [Aspergillus tanneri]
MLKSAQSDATVFYDFSLYGQVDDLADNHRIQACSSFGPDFSQIAPSSLQIASAESVDVEFEIGWWDEGFGLATSGLRPLIIYGQSGQATIGLYIGGDLLNQSLSESALKMLQDNLASLNVSTPSLAMQLCGSHYDSTHIFGVMATSNGTFAPIQRAIKSWINATCLSFSGSMKFPGQAMFTTPLLHTIRTTNATVLAREELNARAHGECRTV